MTDEPDPQADVPQATPDPARSLAVDTPVAKPLPKRHLVTRRIFILGGFWSAMALIPVGLIGSSLDFMWPRGGGGFGGPINVTPDRIPAVGESTGLTTWTTSPCPSTTSAATSGAFTSGATCT